MPTRNPNILTRFLSPDDARRLYTEHPNIDPDPDNYCPTCQKSGEYLWQGEFRKCECDVQLQLHKHYLVAGIGVLYQRLTWDDYQGDPVALEIVRKYLEGHTNMVGRGTGFILSGTYGTGKTLLMTLLLKELVKLGYSGYATTFASMIEMFTAGWRSPEDQRHFQRKIMQSEVLLLDDLGREMKTKTKLSETTFDDVLRSRVQGGRPTLITTNMDHGQLSSGYGGAILSLLSEVCIRYEMVGLDFRPQSAERSQEEFLRGEVRPIF